MADLGFDFPDDVVSSNVNDDNENIDIDHSDDTHQQQQFNNDNNDNNHNIHEEAAAVVTAVNEKLDVETQQVEQDIIESEIAAADAAADDNPSTQMEETEQEPELQDELEDELLTDENVTPLERVYGFKEDDALINRLLLAKELSNALEEISLNEAVEDVLPIMEKLAADPDDTVKETFANELYQVLLYFYKNVPALFTNPTDSSNKSQEKTIAPVMIRLLLDQSSNVASLAQQAIVSIVGELYQLSSRQQNSIFQQIIQTEIFQGVIDGLIQIVDGRKKPPGREDKENNNSVDENDNHESLKYHRVSIDDGGPADRRRRNSSTPGFEPSPNVHHASSSDEEFDQSEISLAKVTCISLLSTIVGVFDPEMCTEKLLPLIEQLSSDPLFYVRREAAVAIGNLAQVVNPQLAEERLLPLYQRFTEDQVWHVRRSCVHTLPLLCGALPEESKVETAVNSVEKFRNDMSRNVRNSLADIVGGLVSKFLPPGWEESDQPGKLPEPLLNYFLSLGSNTNNSSNSNAMLKLEIDRTYICAYNFPAVVRTAGVEYWDSHFRNTYLDLTKDYQIKVRCTFAHSLHVIAGIVGPELTEKDLVQIFALYLMDLDEVKQGVLEHLAEFLKTLAASSRNEYIPILAEVWDGVSSNWHLRNILASQLKQISLLFDASRVVENVLPLVVRACHDEFATIRETGVKVFPAVLDVVKRAVEEDGESLSQADGYGDDVTENKRNFALALLSHVMERLDEFARSESYRGRLVFAQICKALIEDRIDASDFASFFLPRLAPLAYDPVINVRIAASRTIGAIYTNEPFRQELSEIAAPSRTVNQAGESSHALEQMTYRFALDKDADVRSFVMAFVDPDVLEKQREKEIKAAVKIAEDAIEARVANGNHNSDDDDDEEEEEEEESNSEEEEDSHSEEEEEEEEEEDEILEDEDDEEQVGTPMQDIESETTTENIIESTIATGLAEDSLNEIELMDTTNHLQDEDEIMSEADPIPKEKEDNPNTTTFNTTNNGITASDATDINITVTNSTTAESPRNCTNATDK